MPPSPPPAPKPPAPRPRPRTGLDMFLDLPAFLAGVFGLYWSLPIAALVGEVRFWQVGGTRNDALGWAVALTKMFGARFVQLPGPGLMKEPACLYLANHRSWADFFLDVMATDGRGQMLSRMAVAFAFPAFMAAVCVIRSVILFRRGRVTDKAAFNAMVTARMDASPVEGLIVYPEGHRSTRPGPLPLKRGMLAYAWHRQIPVQVVMSSGKEAVIAEKLVAVRWGRTIVVGYSDPIRPASFPDFDAFVAAVTVAWAAQWDRVAAAAPSDGVDRPVVNLMERRYPRRIRVAQVFVTGAIVAVFLSVCWFGVRAAGRAYRAAGAGGPALALLLVAWCGVSARRALTAPAPAASMQPVAAAKAK